MASLTTFIRKFGKVRGRKKYNEWHREYRKANKARMRKYWRDYYHTRKNASKIAV